MESGLQGKGLAPLLSQCPPPLNLQATAKELQAQSKLLGEVEQNLQAVQRCSGRLASGFQEHCPDLERQEAEVHKLAQRLDNLRQQVEHR